MHAEVYKFGGASVHSPEGVRNVVQILRDFDGRGLMVVISAMGKTTNALERILHDDFAGDPVSLVETFGQIRDFHLDIVHELFADRSHPVFPELEALFGALRQEVIRKDKLPYDERYDRIVSFGERFSSLILFHFLRLKGIDVQLFDATSLIRTDSTFRDARVEWRPTQVAVQRTLFPYFQGKKGRVGLTQGFIGSDLNGRPTTLGREGSDYTAAILGYCMRVRRVTIWKDVPGILNADPKWMSETVKLDRISYHEAIELAWYGATVVHPKTIKPLENAGITLIVRSFLNPSLSGTEVVALQEWKIGTPVFIRKRDQVLLSVSPRDFSFIVEENLSQIFATLARLHIKANVMQLSAISFSLCFDPDPGKLQSLIGELRQSYEVRYNEGLELITIRHYTDEAIARISADRRVLLEQKSRNSIHLVLDPKS